MEVDRFKNFTDEEIYMMQRTFTEAGADIILSEKYSDKQKKIYEKLYNEIIEEDKFRLYGLEEYNRRMIERDYPDEEDDEYYPRADVNDRVFD